MDMNKQHYQKWLLNKTINPITNRHIKLNGPTYTKFMKFGEKIATKISSKDNSDDDEKIATKKSSKDNSDGEEIATKKSSKDSDDEKIATNKDKTNNSDEADRLEISNYLTHQFALLALETNSCIGKSPFLKNPQLLGSGSFGQVYKATFSGSTKDYIIAAKQSFLSTKEKNSINKAIAAKQKTLMESYYPGEYRFHILLKEALENKLTQNFLFVYGMTFCKMCSLTLNKKNKEGFCSVTLMEMADGDLRDWERDIRHKTSSLEYNSLLENILFQILSAVYVLQKVFSLLHNDIKAENILIKRIASGGYWKYIIEGETYFIPNMGVIALIADFGVSRSFDLKYSLDGYLGERNAKIVDGKFQPFVTSFFLSFQKGKLQKMKPSQFNWVNRQSGTRNRFHKTIGNFNKKFMLSDLYPPFEFFYDLQDVVRLFLGGKRLSQPQSHNGLYVSEHIKKLLEPYYIENSLYNSSWSFESVKYFLASYMIKDLFSSWTVKKEPVIAVFKV